MERVRLILFIAGKSLRSSRAIENLNRLCEEALTGRYEIVVHDVLENPQLAEDFKILATPTVIRELPQPVRRVVGDLSNPELALTGLGLPIPWLPRVRRWHNQPRRTHHRTESSARPAARSPRDGPTLR